MKTLNKPISFKNEIRNNIQKQAVELLYKYRCILLSWATGCGKTLASLKMLKEITTHIPEAKGYIICKESNHISNWKDDIVKHNYQKLVLKHCYTFLYASLHKYSGHGFVDFVILDEGHAITEARAKHLSKIIGPRTVVIILSATVEYQKKYMIKKLCNGLHEYHISIMKAIALGLIPEPKLFIHYYKMTDAEQTEYDEVERLVNKAKSVYHGIQESDEDEDDWAKIKMVNAGSVRKRLIAEMKTKRAKNLISTHFKNCRYICFTGSKRQAMDLNGFNYVHSGRTREQNLKKKESFNSGRINNLFVVNMFREAMNLNNIEKGLIVQLDNVKLSFIQMLGRVFRSNSPEMHIMIIKDTKDEKYLSKVMKGFDKKYINVINH